ncbi:MAG: hydrolase [Kiritimatiellae bacterium]|nr:hydrolase [Kiritimatiellia bacterium]
MFELGNTAFVLVDVQGKLASVMHEREALYRNLKILLRGMLALRVPLIWMEQIPEKMGPTIPELTAHLDDHTPIPKACFSCCGNDAFLQALKASGARQVVMAGIETHVCIYQTARDLLDLGFEVEVVADAVSSRFKANRDIALQKIAGLGAGITSAESMLFELMRTSEHPAFRDILKIVK